MTINGGAGEIEAFAMANCRHMILSSQTSTGATTGTGDQIDRMFSCKTCGRKFSSFQALGGHRASHQRHKPSLYIDFPDQISSSPAKPKTHACSICGLEFPIGQALGGHMRRHRPLSHSAASGSTVTAENSIENSDSNDNNRSEKKRSNENDVVGVPVSSKRICLDLNLSLCWLKDDDDVHDVVVDDDRKKKDAEIVYQHDDCDEEERDFLKLELMQPINFSASCH